MLANDFDGNAFDEIPSASLLCFVDNSHPSFKKFSDDFVPKFILNCEQRHEAMFDEAWGKSSPRPENFLGKLCFFACAAKVIALYSRASHKTLRQTKQRQTP